MRRVISSTSEIFSSSSSSSSGSPCEMSRVPLGDINVSDHETLILLQDFPYATIVSRQPVNPMKGYQDGRLETRDRSL